MIFQFSRSSDVISSYGSMFTVRLFGDFSI